MIDKKLVKLLRENQTDCSENKEDIFFANNLVEIKNKIIDSKNKKSFFSFRTLSYSLAILLVVVIPLILVLSGIFQNNVQTTGTILNISYEKAMFFSEKNFELLHLARAGYDSAKIELFNSIYYDIENNATFDTNVDYSMYSDTEFTNNTQTKTDTMRLTNLAYAYTDYLINS